MRETKVKTLGKSKNFNNTKIKRCATKKERGITLIALVITIIILLILAAVTIAALSGDNGILSNAAKAKEETEKAEIIEQIRLDIYGEMSDNQGKDPTEADIERIADEYGEISGTNFEDKILTTEQGNYEINLSDIWTPAPATGPLQPGEEATAERNEYYDAEANKTAKIPVGFTVSDKKGETSINGGLVVYAPDKSEYVWIPVDGVLQETEGDGGKTIQDAINGEIILGRYVFKEDGTIDTTLTPTTLGGQLKTSSTDSYYFTEDTPEEHTYGNAEARDIDVFIQSVRDNGGYYVARYEASKNTSTNKADSKYNKTVWATITQPNASIACQNLYEGVNSDLVNSYAWDTAILFIQKYSGDSDYSRQDGVLTRTETANTGEGILLETDTVDKQCNIYDMAGNYQEWTTETCSSYPCAIRGGVYYSDSGHYTSDRDKDGTAARYSHISFRPLLYL